MHFVISRTALKEMALVIFFLLSFSIMKNFPGLELIGEIWIVAIFIFMITFYFGDRLKKGFWITQFEGYILLLLVWVPICAAIQSRSEFGQPLIYGLLAQRNIVLAASAIILLQMLRQKRITLPVVESALVKLSWASLVAFTFARLVMEPGQFHDAGNAFISGVGEEDAAFKFNSTCIVIGFFYYIFNGFWRRNITQGLLAIPFLWYLVIIDAHRALLLSVFGSLVFFLYRWSSFGRLLKLVPKALLFAVLLFAAVLVFKQDYMVDLVMRFGDAFAVVLTGEETTDASSNARISETLIATPYIVKHWAFGNGSVSYQWKGGFESLLGYFYPSDIGIVGATFLFGLFGVLLFSIQFKFAIHYANRLPKNGGEHGVLVSVAKAFLLFIAFHSLVTGRFVHFVEVGLLFIVILYWAARMSKNTRSTV